MSISKLVCGLLMATSVAACLEPGPNGDDGDGDDGADAAGSDVGDSTNTPVTPSVACKSASTTAELVQTINSTAACVELAPGTYVINGQLPLHPGQLLRGVGATAPNIIIRASASFPAGGAFGLIRALGAATDHPGTIENITLDGAGVAFLGVQGTNARVLHSQIFNTRCNGVSILGTNSFEVGYSVIRYNGGSCPTAPPGAGIYVHGGTVISIHDNYIQNNVGPAIDVNRVHSVYSKHIDRNIINDNTGWAAISLFDTTSWSISGNHVSQPKTSAIHPYNAACDAMPNGVPRSAALFLCEQSVGDGVSTPTFGNYIAHNQFIGAIGILLTGNRPNVPLSNSIYGNDVFGSTIGCADASSATQGSPNRYNGVTDKSRQCWGGNVTRF
jgi:Right handed beta helix region